jgi:hypothetical protein
MSFYNAGRVVTIIVVHSPRIQCPHTFPSAPQPLLQHFLSCSVTAAADDDADDALVEVIHSFNDDDGFVEVIHSFLHSFKSFKNFVA